MKKVILSFDDIKAIIEGSLHVIDKYGIEVKFIDFKQYTLSKIMQIIDTKGWYYEPIAEQ